MEDEEEILPTFEGFLVLVSFWPSEANEDEEFINAAHQVPGTGWRASKSASGTSQHPSTIHLKWIQTELS